VLRVEKSAGKYGLLILFTVCVTYFIENFLRSAPSALLPVLIDELGLTHASAGLLVSSFSLLYAFMQVPSGILSVAIGPRRTIIGFTVFSVVGVFAFYLGSSFEVLLIAQMLIGLGFSVFYINAINIVTRWFPREKRASAIGILSASMGLGTFASYTGFPLSLGFTGGWRTFYLLCSVLLVVNFVMNFVILRDSPEPEKKERTGSDASMSGSIVQVLRSRAVYPFIVGYVLACFSWVFISWTPKYLMDTRGLSYLGVGLVSSAANLAGIPGCIIIGLVSDHLRRRRLPLVAFSAAYTGVLALFLTVPGWLPEIAFILIAIALGFFTSLWVLLFSMVPEVLPPRLAGIGLGVMNGLGTLGFAVVAPVYGALVDSTGGYVLSNSMILLGATVMTIVIIIFTHETYRTSERS
jgi:predicted MFS family arabinose efflux permease